MIGVTPGTSSSRAGDGPVVEAAAIAGHDAVHRIAVNRPPDAVRDRAAKAA